MTKVRALNKDGQITWCTAKVPGHGNCNHLLHQNKDVTDTQFQQAADEYNEKMSKLVHSSNFADRIEAARAGYGLPTLVNDEDSFVRGAVAEQGYGLPTLVKDESAYVKVAVAKKGYGLPRLSKDPDYQVRREVARQGYNPPMFAIDYDEVTRSIAQQKIAEEKDPKVKKQYKEQINGYINGTFAQKLACVNAGIGIQKLVEDPHKYVRGEVAAHGYLPEVLAYDKDPHVRSQVALSGNCHDILSHDKDEQVRATVASCCNKDILAKMVNDERPLVRQYVAMRGDLLDKEHLDKLLNDQNAYVRQAAQRAINKQ